MPYSMYREHPALVTDLYHPDSAYVSWRTGRNGVTTFDLYTREAPFDGAYMLVAGLEEAVQRVLNFRFHEEDLAYLKQIRDYDPGFLEELRHFRFTGEILAIPEGTIAFPNEPLLRVTAPFRECILIESALLQAVNLATLIATKAARVVWAARGRRVAEFSLRRAQDPFVVARSSYIGGCASTSFVAAAYHYRLLATGTIPHALVTLYDTEREAFEAVASSFNRYNLLIDTYDTRRAIHTAVEVARKYRDEMGHTLVAVRIDSGDLVEDSKSWTRRACRRCAYFSAVTWTSSRSRTCWREALRWMPLASGRPLGSAPDGPTWAYRAVPWAVYIKRCCMWTSTAWSIPR